MKLKYEIGVKQRQFKIRENDKLGKSHHIVMYNNMQETMMEKSKKIARKLYLVLKTVEWLC